MQRFMITFVLLITFLISGCSNPNTVLSGDAPPDVSLTIDDEMYGTILGSYCWSSARLTECVDTAGPVELMEGKEPIKVQSGEPILLVMDFEPKPNNVCLSKIENGSETEVNLKNQTFAAPKDKGIYYYAYSVRWTDEIEEHVSYADAFYAFAIEVQ
ncbi:hypothetical protein SAMN04488126_103192 [Bhargavaea beijingensis]|uniref:Lipoprotein n=1 Tax=Bhargavaea beijingensis TaxID=426756 RepID=A0A1G7A5D4_9BACL|nr:hypothetical protein [Bhargavaea beijingensis]SDE09833.1 hypothetical protein SAMN04488126_103192 [Bhargavaea beijingensis]